LLFGNSTRSDWALNLSSTFFIKLGLDSPCLLRLDDVADSRLNPGVNIDTEKDRRVFTDLKLV
jgi:hypothetical protein